MCGRALAAGLVLLVVLTIKTRGRPWGALLGLGWPDSPLRSSSRGFDLLHGGPAFHHGRPCGGYVEPDSVFAALAAWVAMREAIRLPVTIAMFLAFAGVALMVSDNYASGAWIGDILHWACPPCSPWSP